MDTLSIGQVSFEARAKQPYVGLSYPDTSEDRGSTNRVLLDETDCHSLIDFILWKFPNIQKQLMESKP